LQKFAKNKNLSIYAIIKGWADNIL
jgi:hypothetical protein